MVRETQDSFLVHSDEESEGTLNPQKLRNL